MMSFSVKNIRITLLAAVIGLLVCQSVSAEPYAVYILTGQSNSLGTTRFEGETLETFGPGNDAADRTIGLFWSNVKSTNTTYPAVAPMDSGGEIKTLQVQQGGLMNPVFWGPEFGFTRAMHGLGDKKLLIIKASRSGGGNTLWDRDAFLKDAHAGHMWGHLIDTVDAALAQLHDAGHRFEVRGLLYMQGESNNAQEAKIAGKRLGALSDNLKAHINTKYKGSASGMRVVAAEIAASDTNQNRRLTTTQQQKLAKSRDDIAFVKTRDLPVKEDKIHFGRDAKLQTGYRMATAMHGLMSDMNRKRGKGSG